MISPVDINKIRQGLATKKELKLLSDQVSSGTGGAGTGGNAAELIAAHVASAIPHPNCVLWWVQNTIYSVGDMRCSPFDGRVYVCIRNFDNGNTGDGDPFFDKVTLLTDIRDGDNVPVDISSYGAELNAQPDVVSANSIQGSHQALTIAGYTRQQDDPGVPVYDFIIPSAQTQFGTGDLCIEIAFSPTNNDPDNVYRDLIDFGSFKIGIISGAVRLTAPGDYEITQTLDSLNLSSNVPRRIIFSRKNGLWIIGVTDQYDAFTPDSFDAIPYSNNFPSNLSSTTDALIGGPNGFSGNLSYRITVGESRFGPWSNQQLSYDVRLDNAWSTITLVGPSVLPPGFDTVNWELKYNPPSLSSQIEDVLRSYGLIT